MATRRKHSLPVMSRVRVAGARRDSGGAKIEYAAVDRPSRHDTTTRSRRRPRSRSRDLPSCLAGRPTTCGVNVSGGMNLSHDAIPYKDIWDQLGPRFRTLWLGCCMGAPTGPGSRNVDIRKVSEAFASPIGLSESLNGGTVWENLSGSYRLRPVAA